MLAIPDPCFSIFRWDSGFAKTDQDSSDYFAKTLRRLRHFTSERTLLHCRRPHRSRKPGKPQKGCLRHSVIAWGLCCALSPFLVGCRSLGTNRQTRGLVNARQLSLRGAGLLEQQNFSQAGPLFSEALRHSPYDERAHWGNAQVLWEEGEEEKAIQHMAKAAELSGRDPDLVVRLGEMYLQSGHVAEAEAQAERAIEISHQHAAAWALQGKVLRHRQQYDEAMIKYQRSLDFDPENPDTRIAVAEIHQLQGNPQRALATLDYLADCQPTEDIPARAWMLRGQAYAMLGEQMDSAHCLQMATDSALDCDCPLLLDLAQIQAKMGDVPRARECLGRALRTNPANQRALALQAQLDHGLKMGTVTWSQPVP